MADAGNRKALKARPVDVSLRLQIIRTPGDVGDDEPGSRVVPSHGHQLLDRENEEVLTVKSREPKQGKADEIPTPEVWPVPGYEQDYRAVYRPPAAYARAGHRPAGSSEGPVEYDLDDEDEDWLRAYNGDDARLPAEKLELMLWKLEVACAEAQAQALAETQAASERGAAPLPHADRVSLAANLSCLSREAAFEALQSVSKRPAAIEAVHAYWLARRARSGKPLLRRLQPPPAVTDANPFNVFRARERTNRPQTRRRRENDVAAFARMRSMRHNLDTARAVLEWLQRRERRKRDILACECETQAVSMRVRHEPARGAAPQQALAQGGARDRGLPDAVDGAAGGAGDGGGGGAGAAGAAGAAAAAQLLQQQRPGGGGGGVGGAADAAAAAAAEAARARKRRRDGLRRGPGGALDLSFVPPPEAPHLAPPPCARPPLLPPPPAPGWAAPPPAALCGRRGRLRWGRGGRLVWDRVHPVTGEPYDTPDPTLAAIARARRPALPPPPPAAQPAGATGAGAGAGATGAAGAGAQPAGVGAQQQQQMQQQQQQQQQQPRTNGVVDGGAPHGAPAWGAKPQGGTGTAVAMAT